MAPETNIKVYKTTNGAISQYHAILRLAYPVFEKVENSNVLKQQGYDGLASHGCWPSGPPTERRARQRASGRFWVAEVQGDPGSSWVNPGITGMLMKPATTSPGPHRPMFWRNHNKNIWKASKFVS